MACGAGYKQVRHLGEVRQVHLIGDGGAERDGKMVFRFLICLRIQNCAHRDGLLHFVGNLDAYGTLAGNRGDDTYAAGCKAQCDVVGQATYFGNLNAILQSNLIKSDGGSDGCLDLGNGYSEVEKGLLDLVLVFKLLLLADVYLCLGGV